jgi:hypothetical protein
MIPSALSSPFVTEGRAADGRPYPPDDQSASAKASRLRVWPKVVASGHGRGTTERADDGGVRAKVDQGGGAKLVPVCPRTRVSAKYTRDPKVEGS